MIYDLPRELDVNGVSYAIRSDFRDVLNILLAFADPNLQDSEKAFVCLNILYKDIETIPQSDYQAAYNAAIEFIDHGSSDDDKKGPRTMDWEQDAKLIFPSVNRVAGYEVRSVEYLHWWTFIGYFMEIKDDTYSMVLALRQKKAKGKKLEKNEREFWNENHKICKLQNKLTDEEKAEKARLKAILG